MPPLANIQPPFPVLQILTELWARRQRIAKFREEVLKEKVSAEESYGEQFSANGQIYDWNEEN